MLIFILLAEVDKRTVGYRRRKLSIEKGTHAMLTLLKTAKKAAIPAKYVLFDSWFSSPSTLHAVKRMDLDVIGMLKKSPIPLYKSLKETTLINRYFSSHNKFYFIVRKVKSCRFFIKRQSFLAISAFGNLTINIQNVVY